MEAREAEYTRDGEKEEGARGGGED